MRFLIFGAGAIGSYLGGSLLLQQHEVVFIERAQEAQILRQQGLRMQIGQKTHHIPNPSIVTSIQEAIEREEYDTALFALKAYDTQSALKEMAAFTEYLPPLLCLQNGVENEAALAQILGAENVIAGTVTSSIGRKGVGDIILERERGLGIAAGHKISQNLVNTFLASGIKAQLYVNALAMKWSKMLTNLLANASSAIYNLSPREILADKELYFQEVKQIREALQVMAAQNIPVVNLPSTPVKLLAWLMEKVPPTLSQPLAQQFIGKGRGNKMPSFHIDLHSGRGKSEVSYLNGAVVRFGEQFGIPTPVNRFFNYTLLSLTQRDIPLEKYWKN